MAVRDVVMFGDPILRQKAKKVHHFDASLPRLINDMFMTMHAYNGIGLAGPQIGQLLRLFVIECDDEETGQHHKLAMVNPTMIRAEGEQRGVDGCLSIPGYYGINVRRAAQVVVQGQDARGKPLRVKATGILAWALQHEIDHLDGILFIDRLDRPEDLRKVQKDGLPEEVIIE